MRIRKERGEKVEREPEADGKEVECVIALV